MPIASSVFSSVSIAVKSTLEAALDWPSVSVLWSSTAAAFGSSVLYLAEDRPSASPFPPDPDSGASHAGASPDTATRTVLLVEDNPTDVFVMREVVEDCGQNLRLLIADNGREALRYLQDLAKTEQESFPVLVLLDLNLPKISGIDVLRQLRQDSPCKRTPVIVVTSSTAESDRAAVRRLGAEAYFQKPNDLAGYKKLARLIRSVLDPP
jgi:CheY-like chemotaxis protein